MKDEEYLYYQDLREKKTTGYSARKQRTHCGKGGRVKFPSDNLTKKEIKNMSGECKSYRLNEPMKWKEFLAMPDDIKIAYIKAIREKYGATNIAIAKMMGVHKDALWRVLNKLDMNSGKKGNVKWDEKGFMEWCYGVPAEKEEEPVAEEVEAIPAEEAVFPEVTCADVEVATPVEECPYKQIPNPDIKVNLIKEDSAPAMAVPHSGSLSFEGKTRDILTTLGVLLGGANIKVCVQWEVCDG